MSTNDPVMRGRGVAKPETWGEMIVVAVAWAIALSFIASVCAAAVQAILSGTWVP